MDDSALPAATRTHFARIADARCGIARSRFDLAQFKSDYREFEPRPDVNVFTVQRRTHVPHDVSRGGLTTASLSQASTKTQRQRDAFSFGTNSANVGIKSRE
jgi:hypothetical protein